MTQTMTQTFQFTITAEVESGHPAYDDPEWVADAAWGTLTNEYGLRCTYGEITQLEPTAEDSR